MSYLSHTTKKIMKKIKNRREFIMTNEERKEMYQEWENFVFEIFCQMKKNDGHDSRCALLIETIKDLW